MLWIVIIAGIISSTCWVAQIVFCYSHARWTYRRQPGEDRGAQSSVSVIHPIKDKDFELEKNLDSWLNQDYHGPIEHIFSFQDPHDPALPVVRALPVRYPETQIKILINPLLPGLNGKSSNMVHGLEATQHEFVIFADSDTRVQPDFILKMVLPLKNKEVGIISCAQMNIGGRDFWTRFFTFLQNCETDFHWAFFAWLGFNVGVNGASFGAKKTLIQKIGGFQRFGGSILEDLFLGKQIYRENLHIVVGPFVECHVDLLEREKTFNYLKRLAIGIKRHLQVTRFGFAALLSWYWIFLIVAAVSQNLPVFTVCLGFMGLRSVTGLLQRPVTRNRILPIDLFIPILFDVLMTFYLLFPFISPLVDWRGIRYRMSGDGKIKEVSQIQS